jgi:hypothetical protein
MVDYIAVVSGLPRSGTSMLMRMLAAGGMPILTDHIRKPDENNPRGYYELEGVKKVKEDASWLEGAVGKAFKMVSQLLYELPSDKQYRIIFMQRRMEEVLASQKKMLQTEGKSTGGVSDEQMAMLFRKHLSMVESWLKRQQNMSVLYVAYNEVIRAPLTQAQQINLFLDGRLDVSKMVEVVEPALYRQRQSTE